MAQLPRIQFPEPRSDYDRNLQDGLSSFLSKLIDIINGGIRISDNVNAQTKSYVTNGSANTEDEVAHTLKRVPVGFFLVKSDKAASLYDSGTAWTATKIYLKASAATVAATIVIF